MNTLTQEMKRSLRELDLGLKGELTITSDMEDLSNSLFFDQVKFKPVQQEIMYVFNPLKLSCSNKPPFAFPQKTFGRSPPVGPNWLMPPSTDSRLGNLTSDYPKHYISDYSLSFNDNYNVKLN